MNNSRLFRLLTDLGEDMKKHNINAYAASAAFFLFLSLVPMLALLCSLLPYTGVTEQDLLTFVQRLAPDIFDGLLTEMIEQVYDASGVLTISAVVTVWIASKGTMALIQGLNVVEGVEEKRNYFHVRIVSCFYMLLMLIALLFSLILIAAGNTAVQRLLAFLPVDLSFIRDVLLKPRALYMLIVLTIVFAVLYALLPYRKLKYREQLPGAMVAAVSWIVFSFFFSIYVKNATSLTIYGSLTMLVVSMLWMYCCMYLLLLGAYLNRYFRPVNRVLVYRKSKRPTKDD